MNSTMQIPLEVPSQVVQLSTQLDILMTFLRQHDWNNVASELDLVSNRYSELDGILAAFFLHCETNLELPMAFDEQKRVIESLKKQENWEGLKLEISRLIFMLKNPGTLTLIEVMYNNRLLEIPMMNEKTVEDLLQTLYTSKRFEILGSGYFKVTFQGQMLRKEELLSAHMVFQNRFDLLYQPAVWIKDEKNGLIYQEVTNNQTFLQLKQALHAEDLDCLFFFEGVKIQDHALISEYEPEISQQSPLTLGRESVYITHPYLMIRQLELKHGAKTIKDLKGQLCAEGTYGLSEGLFFKLVLNGQILKDAELIPLNTDRTNSIRVVFAETEEEKKREARRLAAEKRSQKFFPPPFSPF